MIKDLEKQFARIKYVENERAKLGDVLKDLDIICSELSLPNADINELSKKSVNINYLLQRTDVYKTMFNTTLLNVFEHLRACAIKQDEIFKEEHLAAAKEVTKLLNKPYH